MVPEGSRQRARNCNVIFGVQEAGGKTGDAEGGAIKVWRPSITMLKCHLRQGNLRDLQGSHSKPWESEVQLQAGMESHI